MRLARARRLPKPAQLDATILTLAHDLLLCALTWGEPAAAAIAARLVQHDVPEAMRPCAEDVIIAALASEAPADMIALASRAGILKPAAAAAAAGSPCLLGPEVVAAVLGAGGPRPPERSQWAGSVVMRPSHGVPKNADGTVRAEVLAVLADIPGGFTLDLSKVEIDYRVVRTPDLPLARFLLHAGVMTPNLLNKVDYYGDNALSMCAKSHEHDRTAAAISARKELQLLLRRAGAEDPPPLSSGAGPGGRYAVRAPGTPERDDRPMAEIEEPDHPVEEFQDR